MKLLFGTGCLILTLLNATQGAPPRITTRDAKKFIGQEVTICGRVVSYKCTRPRDTILLNLDKPYWDGAVSVGIRSSERSRFGERVEDDYLGAQLCATGRVERVEGQPVVVVDTPESLLLKERRQWRLPAFAPGAVHGCQPDVELPTLVREVKPVYSRAGMRALIQGLMLLDAVVLADGSVGDVRVLYSLDAESGLDDQAMAALKQWRFDPGRLRGQVVPMIVTVEMSFRLK